MTLEDAAAFVQRIVEAGKRERSDMLVLCHGGPIAEPEDAAWIVEHTSGVDGFFGASSIERLAAEVAITQQVRRFKSIRSGHRPAPAGAPMAGS
jgi:predicted TIM-barrel enzyme